MDSEWMKHWPKRPWEFWILVAKQVKAKKIRHTDIKAVRKVCKQVQQQMGENHYE